MATTRRTTLLAALILLLSCGTWFASYSHACAGAVCKVKCHSGTPASCGDLLFGMQECSCFTTFSGDCHAECDDSSFDNDFCSF